MKFETCPLCGTEMLRMSDGKCPHCRRQLPPRKEKPDSTCSESPPEHNREGDGSSISARTPSSLASGEIIQSTDGTSKTNERERRTTETPAEANADEVETLSADTQSSREPAKVTPGQRIWQRGLQFGKVGLVLFIGLLLVAELRAASIGGGFWAPGWLARAIGLGIGAYVVFFSYGASFAFGECYRSRKFLATVMAGGIPLLIVTLTTAIFSMDQLLEGVVGMGLPACLLGIILVGDALYAKGKGLSYSKCPTCGYSGEAFIFRCKACQHLYCWQCSPRRRCPGCGSRKKETMGRTKA